MRTSLFIFLVFHLQLTGQTKKDVLYESNIDTISVQNDSVFAKITFFENDRLTDELTAFLFPDTVTIPRYRLMALRHVFKARVPVTRLLKHGKDIEYKTDGRKKLREFKFQKLLAIHYYDPLNKEISQAEYNIENSRCGPGEDAVTYLFTARQKRK